MHKTAFKKVPSSTIPLFEETDKKSRSPRKHSPCVVIQRNGKDYFINKTTVVLLLQEGERVSSNRLFWVRSKQLYSSDILKSVSCPVSNKPSTYDEIALGDVCVFEHQETSTWRIGKVPKFSYYKQKAKASRQYRGSVAKVISTENIGVLCSWYSKLKELTYTCVPTAVTEEVVHSYIPTSLCVQ